MRHWLRLIAVLVCVGMATASVVFFGAYQATQSVPTFYEAALQTEPNAHEEAGNELERQVLELHNEVLRKGTWQATFTDAQINGWLAADLPVKFPNTLPPDVDAPRVAIQENLVQVACRYHGPQMKTVISLAASIYLTDEPNVVAIRVNRAYAGAMPVPLAAFLDDVSQKAHESEIELRWTQIGDDPVALVKIPTVHEDYAHGEVHIRTVELRDGEVYLSGNTDAQEVAGTATALLLSQDENSARQ